MADVDVYILRLYYHRIFPSQHFYKWLCYGNPFTFAHREISFSCEDDVFIRYLSFDTFKEFLDKLYQKIPLKINIGAIYDKKPKDRTRQGGILNAKAKEIVFDIDITDYDSVRTCCQGPNICKLCWRFMAIATRILDVALREDFGCDHILWAFSGRRGIHCWVADPWVTSFGPYIRSCIAAYLRVSGKLKPDFIHDSISRALFIIDDYFLDFIIVEENVLGSNEGLKRFLSLIDINYRDMFEKKMEKAKTSVHRWTTFEDFYDDLKSKGQLPSCLNHLIQEIKLHYAYPRLDLAVTKSMEHLLKSPFCLHPGTGKVCVPFRAEDVDSFNPDKVPTIHQLIREIDEYDMNAKKNLMDTSDNSVVRIPDYKKTSILEPVQIFEEFIERVAKANKEFNEN